MPPPIVFHDGDLRSVIWNGTDALSLCIELDSVWNGGSNRRAWVALTGIRNPRDVDKVFRPLPAEPFEIRPMETPIIGRLEVLWDSDLCLVAIDFVFLRSLTVICTAVTCDGLPMGPVA